MSFYRKWVGEGCPKGMISSFSVGVSTVCMCHGGRSMCGVRVCRDSVCYLRRVVAQGV